MQTFQHPQYGYYHPLSMFGQTDLLIRDLARVLMSLEARNMTNGNNDIQRGGSQNPGSYRNPINNTDNKINEQLNTAIIAVKNAFQELNNLRAAEFLYSTASPVLFQSPMQSRPSTFTGNHFSTFTGVDSGGNIDTNAYGPKNNFFEREGYNFFKPSIPPEKYQEKDPVKLIKAALVEKSRVEMSDGTVKWFNPQTGICLATYAPQMNIGGDNPFTVGSPVFLFSKDNNVVLDPFNSIKNIFTGAEADQFLSCGRNKTTEDVEESVAIEKKRIEELKKAETDRIKIGQLNYLSTCYRLETNGFVIWVDQSTLTHIATLVHYPVRELNILYFHQNSTALDPSLPNVTEVYIDDDVIKSLSETGIVLEDKEASDILEKVQTRFLKEWFVNGEVK